MTTASTGGRSASAIGGGWKRFGPTSVEGEQRSLQIGSVSTTLPSISTSTEAQPIHVARSPLAGGAPTSFHQHASIFAKPSGTEVNRTLNRSSPRRCVTLP